MRTAKRAGILEASEGLGGIARPFVMTKKAVISCAFREREKNVLWAYSKESTKSRFRPRSADKHCTDHA